MAKEQNLALNPNKISGQCGRLLCCLNYEYETYRDYRKSLPKCGRKVVVDGHEGTVVAHNVLARRVTVRREDNVSLEVSVEQLSPLEKTPEKSTPSTPAPKTEPSARPRGRQSSGRNMPSPKPATVGGPKENPPAKPQPKPTEADQGDKSGRKKSRRRPRRRPANSKPSGDKNG